MRACGTVNLTSVHAAVITTPPPGDTTSNSHDILTTGFPCLKSGLNGRAKVPMSIIASPSQTSTFKFMYIVLVCILHRSKNSLPNGLETSKHSWVGDHIEVSLSHIFRKILCFKWLHSCEIETMLDRWSWGIISVVGEKEHNFCAVKNGYSFSSVV